MRALFSGLAVAAFLMTLVGGGVLGRDTLAERFPYAARTLCGVLGCRLPPRRAFEIVRVEKVWPDEAGDRRSLHLEVTYRATNPDAMARPVVDVVVFDDGRVLAHASVEIVEPRVVSDDVWVAAIAMPMQGSRGNVGFEVTLR